MKNRYPKDWKLRSRFIRFYRAKNHCEKCGCENGRPHPITGSTVVLTVAHVYDDRPESCSLLNLAAWCQLCHNRHDAKRRAADRRARREAAGGQLFLFPPSHATIQSHYKSTTDSDLLQGFCRIA